MSHKRYKIFSVYTTLEGSFRDYIFTTSLSETPPNNVEDKAAFMYIEGWRNALLTVSGIESEFEFEEIK